MAVLEYESIEIDFCIKCRGIWLDSGELELLLNSGDSKKVVQSALADLENAGIEKKRKCPICDRKMLKKHFSHQDTSVTVDMCPHNHGIWFDDGELHAIINCVSCGKDNKVINFLRQLFTQPTEP